MSFKKRICISKYSMLTGKYFKFFKNQIQKKNLLCKSKTPQNNFYIYLERRTSLCNLSVNFHRNNGLHICINFDGHAQFLNGSSFRSKSYMLFHKPRQTQQINSHSSLFPNVRNLHSALFRSNIHTCISKQELINNENVHLVFILYLCLNQVKQINLTF